MDVFPDAGATGGSFWTYVWFTNCGTWLAFVVPLVVAGAELAAAAFVDFDRS